MQERTRLPKARLVALLLAIGHGLLAWNCAVGGPLVGPNRLVFWVYVGLALVSALALIVPARLAPKLALLVLSSSLGLAGIETWVRHSGRFALLRLPQSYDRRARAEVIAALGEEGVEAVPNFSPGFFLRPGTAPIGGVPTIVFGGISRSHVVHCNSNESGLYARYQSDEHGFNNPLGLWDGEPLDVALVGDSFTNGACVDVRYADLIRERYPRTLNLGADGTGPLMQLATLKEYLPELRPKRVLWCYYEGNDPTELNREKGSELLLGYLETDFVQGLRARQAEIDAHLSAIVDRRIRRTGKEPPGPTPARMYDDELRLAPRLRLSVTQRHLKRFWRPPAKVEDLDARLFERILGDARTTVESWGGTLVFVYVTGYDTTLTGVSHPWRKVVLAIAERVGIEVVDTELVFREHADALSLFPFRRAGHYTEEGNRVVADAILAAIED